MTRYTLLACGVAALIASAALPLSSTHGLAQPGCSEGKKDGQCVNEAVGAAGRHRANINTQQKVTYSAPPVPPSQDRQRLVPFPYFEYLRGVFSTNPVPYSCHPNC